MQKPLLKNLRTKIMLVLVVLVFPAALAAFALSGSKNYALISFAMVIMAIVPFLMLYEMHVYLVTLRSAHFAPIEFRFLVML